MSADDLAPGIRKHQKYEALIARAKTVTAAATLVVHPCDAASLSATCEAALEGLIDPILLGPKAKIARAAEKAELDMKPLSWSMWSTARQRRPKRWSSSIKPRASC